MKLTRLIERKYSTVFLCIGLVILGWSAVNKFKVSAPTPTIVTLLAPQMVAPTPKVVEVPTALKSGSMPPAGKPRTAKIDKSSAMTPTPPSSAPTEKTPKKSINWFEIIDKFSHILGWIVTSVSAYNLFKKKKATESL